MSGEYISREAAYNAIVNNYAVDDQLCDLDKIPAADVVEVRYGRWKRRISWNCYVCSECSFENDKAYTFCPNCGAKMDGGQDDV